MAAKKQPKKRVPRKPKKPAEAELKPHKIVGQLIGARFNEHGEIVGEESMGDVAIFKPNFGKVQQMVDRAIKETKAQEAIVKEAISE